MPTYVYRREDGTTFEVQQRITESALETCPDTGQPVKRVISGNAGLIFKGSGFYLTDYARSGAPGGTSGSAAGDGAAADAAPSASENSSKKEASSSGSSSSDSSSSGSSSGDAA